jgi:peptide subunit release factor RF-3
VSEPKNFLPPRIVLVGHPSSHPRAVAEKLQLSSAQVVELEGPVDIDTDISQSDLFVLVISAKTGVSAEMTSTWNIASEKQVPRIVIVNGLEMNETDFDDIVLIANRVLESAITPYLVLHDEIGEPVGLISLSDNQVRDYSSGVVTIYPADSELQSLVAEFKEELEESTIEFDSSAFQAGLIVPALPFVASRNIGVAEFQAYLELVTKR